MIPIHDDNPTRRPALITWGLIGTCVLIFLLHYAGSPAGAQKLIFSFGLIPAVLNDVAQLPSNIAVVPAEITILTSMFLHGGFMHLAGNMLYLWIFGDNAEEAMGHVKFLIFYLLCGGAAAAAQIVHNPNSVIPMVGASGAISGVLGAYLLVYPRAKVLVLIPLGFIMHTVRLPAAMVLGIWFIVQFVSSLASDPTQPGVAWYAHLGGFIAGCALVPMFKSKSVALFQAAR